MIGNTMLAKHPIAFVLFLIGLTACGRAGRAAETAADPTEKKFSLTLHAGDRDRIDVPLCVLLDSEKAQGAWVDLAEGGLSRAQVTEPGLANAQWRGKGKQELHFWAPKLTKGQVMPAVARLSERPIEGRHYVWSGEPHRNRRLSCSQCHQGLDLPTGSELRKERQCLDETGKAPPLVLPRLLPTAEGHDFRWHEKSKQLHTSACWECHGRHLVEYEFGQSLRKPSYPVGAKKEAEAPPAARSVYHRLFRVDGDVLFDHAVSTAENPSGGAAGGFYYGFSTLRSGNDLYGDVVQRHAGTLSEEAGKFLGRHNVLIHWVSDERSKVLAKEERQVTVKNTRARNGSRANWIDFASRLEPTGGPLRLEPTAPLAGFHFVPPLDGGAAPEHRQSNLWTAVAFDFRGDRYTAVCFNHPANPRPVPPAKPSPGKTPSAIGWRFAADLAPGSALFVQYRLWIQGGTMPTEEIEAMTRDWLEPVRIEVK